MDCMKLVKMRPNIVVKALFYFGAFVVLYLVYIIAQNRKFNKSVVRLDDQELDSLDQADPAVFPHVLQHMVDPSKLDYAFESTGLDETVLKIWTSLKNTVRDSEGKGFFVEAGAYDGVTSSTTLWLEVVQGWTGLLVECHPEVIPLLKRKNRKAYITDVCLSKYSHPATAELKSVNGWRSSSSLGSGDIFPDFAVSYTNYQIQTIPLYSLLAAINVTTVDFVSLDIQSLEYEVLKNFPFELIFVKAWLIEIVLLPAEVQESLKLLMHQKGYVGPNYVTTADMFFIHSSFANTSHDNNNESSSVKPEHVLL